MEDLTFKVYKQMLLELSDYVEDHNLEAMKFRCSHFIKVKEREKIKYAHQLWIALEQREFIGPTKTRFLKELIKTCIGGQINPLHIVEAYESQLGIESGASNEHIRLQNMPFEQSPCAIVTHIPQIVYTGQKYIQETQYGLQLKQNESPYIGPDLSKDIAFLTKSLGHDWRFFIRALGVDEAVIENTSCDYPTVRERIHKCLMSWLDQQQQSASREKLVEALAQIERNDLAGKLNDNSLQ